MTVTDLRVFLDYTPVTLWRCNKCGVIVGKEEGIPFHKCKPVAVNFGKEATA